MKTIKYDDRVETLNEKGERHSFNDKPAIDYYYNGDKYWYKEGKIYRRENNDGTKFWYKDGDLHRIDGPAAELNYGIKYWYYEGKLIKCKSTEEFLKVINLKAFW